MVALKQLELEEGSKYMLELLELHNIEQNLTHMALVLEVHVVLLIGFDVSMLLCRYLKFHCLYLKIQVLTKDLISY
jgi:hypothetical protein